VCSKFDSATYTRNESPSIRFEVPWADFKT
jgi:hypothetical protein